MPSDGLQRFTEDVHPWVVRNFGHSPGLNEHDARSEVETERQNFLDVFDARLLILGRVESAAQRTAERGQLQIMGAKQMTELAPSRFGQSIRGKVADCVHLHAGDAQPFCLRQGAPQWQTERFQTYTDFQTIHGKLDKAYLLALRACKVLYRAHSASVTLASIHLSTKKKAKM